MSDCQSSTQKLYGAGVALPGLGRKVFVRILRISAAIDEYTKITPNPILRILSILRMPVRFGE
jgi:hypothetical protein